MHTIAPPAQADGIMPATIIESLDHEGRGVARHEGKTIFIEGALPQEQVDYSSYRRKPNYELATASRILTSNALRVVPRCRHFGICGGCSMQHLDASGQAAAKQRVLASGALAARSDLSGHLRTGLGLSFPGAVIGSPGAEEGRGAGGLPREAQQLYR